jgi:hypothetical protein
LVEDLESRAHLLTSFLQAIFMVWTLFFPVTHTLALNKTHNTATQDYPWLHLYIFGAMFTILDCWPCSLQLFFLSSSASQVLNKTAKPKLDQDKFA